MAISDNLLSAYRFHRARSHAFTRAMRPTLPDDEGNRDSGTSARRALNAARRDVEAGKARYPAYEGAPCTRQTDGMVYIDNPARVGLRLVGRVTADTPRGSIWDSRDSSGWYSDNDQGAFGRLYAYVHLIGGEMQRAHVSGYGYDKRSAAVARAIRMLPLYSVAGREPDDSPYARAYKGNRADMLGAVGDMDCGSWDRALEKAGFTVLQAV